jgi:hypothetical protein
MEEEIQKEDVLDSCEEIFSQFEKPCVTEDELSLIGFFEWLLRPETDFIDDILKESELKLEGEAAEDVFFALWEKLMILAFGIGFAVGAWQESLDPNIKRKIEAVRAVIKEKGIFYFAPKARA